MAGKAYVTRMPLGIPGAITRLQDLTAEPVILDAAKPFAATGLAGKNSNGKFVPLEDGDAITAVAGLFIRAYPTMNPTDVRALGVVAGYTGDALKRGYIAVSVPTAQAAASKKGDKVYIRVAAGTEASPLGSIVLTPDSTATNTPELTIAKVMGPGGDSVSTATHGVVEIAYNI